MKKKIAISVIISLILFSLFFVARQQYTIYNTSTKQQNKTDKLPVLNLLSTNGERIITTSFRESSKDKLLVLFNSDCDHCDYQITELINNALKLNKLLVFFISSEPISTLKKYGEKFSITRFENIRMFNLDFTSLTETFDSSITPTLYLYNSDNTLVKQYKGETPLDILLKDIN